MDDPLADGRALHRGSATPASPGGAPGDWYRTTRSAKTAAIWPPWSPPARRRWRSCRRRRWPRPAAGRQRCGEGQSHTHAAAREGVDELEEWATCQQAAPGYLWWEVAAAALGGVDALLAAAAVRRTTAEEAELIDAVYFPPIGALTVLLDDLIDRDDDLRTGRTTT